MEDQIKSSLITLHKVSKFTAKTRIDTTSGDLDEFMDGIINTATRILCDSRVRVRDMLLTKYRGVKEHTKYIIQSKDPMLQKYLPQLRKQIEASVEGLTLYKNNERYKTDKKITATVDHLLVDEIPNQLTIIDEFLAAQE